MFYLVVDEWELSNCDNGANYYLFDSLDKAKAKLEEIAKQDNEEYYEIVEDSYEFEYGLMLIVYRDDAHEEES